jgi:hypothetical protein
MTLELQNSIQNIRGLAPKLNKATDEAARVVAVVEKFLGEECGVGIEVRHHVRGEDGLDDGLWLEYKRHNGKFRLVVTETFVRRDHNGEPIEDNAADQPDVFQRDSKSVAWTEAGRGEKLASFAALPDLLNHLARDMQDSVDSVVAVSTAVEQLGGALQSAALAAPNSPTSVVEKPAPRRTIHSVPLQ